MEYGSAPYVGMTPKKIGCRIKCVQNGMLKMKILENDRYVWLIKAYDYM